DPEAAPRPAPRGKPPLRRPPRPGRAGGGGQAVRRPARPGAGSEPEGRELRPEARGEGRRDGGPATGAAGGAAAEPGPGGRDRAVPPPAAARARSGMGAARPALMGLALATLTLAHVGGTTAGPTAIRVSVTPKEPHPGDVVLVHLSGARPGVRVEWNGQPLRLFPVRD